MASPVISIRDLSVALGGRTILDQLSYDVLRGEILGIIGPSGSGKSVTLKSILGILPAATGDITILGENLATLPGQRRRALQQRLGVLFQQGALFSSLTVIENIEMPMREHLELPASFRRDVAYAKLALVGLSSEAAMLRPSELSGGMIKRAALARALALDPDILFLDEPTAGLDPIGAAKFDDLILSLRDSLGLTVYMVTHDLDSLATACDRIVALAGGKFLASGTIAELRQNGDPWLRDYFHGPRARNLKAS